MTEENLYQSGYLALVARGVGVVIVDNIYLFAYIVAEVRKHMPQTMGH